MFRMSMLDHQNPKNSLCIDVIYDRLMDEFFGYILKWLFHGCPSMTSSSKIVIDALTVAGNYV